MRLAVALHLRHLVDALPLGARLRVLARDRLAGEGVDLREHDPVREVAVVGDREDVAAGLVFIGLEDFPQILGVVAAERLDRRVRLDLPRLVGAVAEDDDAVQIVAARVRGPLVADERT